MTGNAPEYQYNEEYFARNKKARSSWVSKFLLGLAPAPLPTSFEEAVEKCIINDHTRYLPRDSNIVLDAFDPSNQDVVRNWHIRLPNNCMFHANLPWSLTHTHFPEGNPSHTTVLSMPVVQLSKSAATDKEVMSMSTVSTWCPPIDTG